MCIRTISYTILYMDIGCDIVYHIVYYNNYIVRQHTTSYVRIRYRTSGYDIVYSNNTISMSGLVNSLISCARIHEWCKLVLRSDRHSQVCTTVAAFEMDGIIPSSRHAKALPATVLSLFLLATAQNAQTQNYTTYITDIYLNCINVSCLLIIYIIYRALLYSRCRPQL